MALQVEITVKKYRFVNGAGPEGGKKPVQDARYLQVHMRKDGPWCSVDSADGDCVDFEENGGRRQGLLRQ